jgi:hypothetical protein
VYRLALTGFLQELQQTFKISKSIYHQSKICEDNFSLQIKSVIDYTCTVNLGAQANTNYIRENRAKCGAH